MNIPIVTLDKINISPDEINIFFLDCTRISGTDEIISRKEETIDKQIIRIAECLPRKQIILADDVVFSGSVLKKIIDMFNCLGIQTVGIISSVCTNSSFNYFKKVLKYGVKTLYIMSDDVIDQICERDFYFGIAGSGIMMRTSNGLVKAPYFKPYGNPNERASIPYEYERYFSIGCIERSIYMWEEIDKLKGETTLIRDLPEKIINTSENEGVVKTLKKELKRL